MILPLSYSVKALNDCRFANLLEEIRIKYKLPALAAAVVTTSGVVRLAAVGLRKMGSLISVTPDDLWHLGSNTKVMTAILAGTFVAQKKLSWDDKVAMFFPRIAQKLSSNIRDITVSQVLTHQGGLAENLSTWKPLPLGGSIRQERLNAAEWFLESPAYQPGSFHYSNGSYIVIGSILEQIGDKTWEDLMSDRVFAPLHMDSAGFGGTGTEGEIDQPWPHLGGGIPASFNGPRMDNLQYMGPAGSVHCSMVDWGKFLADQLRGSQGLSALLPREIYAAIQTAQSPNNYGFGWQTAQRKWAKGIMLSHGGSNTLNYSACWIGPRVGYGILVCTNEGGSHAGLACDAAAVALNEEYLIELNRDLLSD